jgi:TonB family protein
MGSDASPRWHAQCNHWHVRRSVAGNNIQIPAPAASPLAERFSMKSKTIILSAALLGGLLSVSAFAITPDVHNQINAALKFAAPTVTKVVHPTGLNRRYEGATITVSLTVDETGQAHDVRILSSDDPALARSLVPAITQWQFSPARKNGAPVPAQVVLPIQLVES